jgi:hypothetical protein
MIAFGRNAVHDLRTNKMLGQLRTYAKWLEWICLALLPAGLQRLTVATLQPPLFREFVQGLNNNPILPIFLLALGGLIGKAIQSAAERWVSDHQTIKAVLDAAHNAYFSGVPELHVVQGCERQGHEVCLRTQLGMLVPLWSAR